MKRAMLGLAGGLFVLATAQWGCSEGGGTSFEGAVDALEPADVGGAGPIASPDALAPVDAEVSLDVPDAAETLAPLGAPCALSVECQSGFCAETELGAVCTQECTQECPPGWSCEVVPQVRGGVLQYCLPAFPKLCRPCLSNSDCVAEAGTVGARCVDFGDAGTFCGGDCSAVDCPVGFGCEERPDLSGGASLQCVPLTGECQCSPKAIAEEAETVCASSNNWGSCAGVRQCTDSGLTDCTAPEPALDVCDDVDNDCDGNTDEDHLARGCLQSNEFGACSGTLVCEGGVAACSATVPTAEGCDGVDNDCDGIADEEGAAGCTDFYADGDGDGVGAGAARCLCGPADGYSATRGGDCADGDSSVFPLAPELCNGKDDNCALGVDEKGAIGCENYAADGDGDGYGQAGSAACLCAPAPPFNASQAGDCADGDPAVNPAAAEVCNGKDDDCDGNVDPNGATGCTLRYADGDGDGAGLGDPVCACAAVFPFTALSGGDCNDADPAVRPGQLETCNGKDDDCDGNVDEPGAVGCATWLLDADQDGYGVLASSVCACAPQGDYTAVVAGDCNDGDASVLPATVEQCNGKDDDCNGEVDEAGALGCAVLFADADGDGYGDLSDPRCVCAAVAPYTAAVPGDCADNDAQVSPAAPEACNGIDDDCDAAVDEVGAAGCGELYLDADGDGYGLLGAALCACGPTGSYSASVVGDCDDTAAAVFPGQAEACNAIDDDCDGVVDGPGAAGCLTWFLDADGDGFGVQGSSSCRCAPVAPFTAAVDGDCDDTSAGRSPLAAEGCNGLDDDCDGVIDEGCGLPVLGWPTYQGDVRRSGQTLYVQGPAVGSIKWQTQLAAPAGGAPVIFPDGRVAVVAGSALWLGSATGATQWTFDLGQPAQGQAGATLRAGGTLVVSAGDSIWLVGTDGGEVWSNSFAGESHQASPLVDNAGRIYASSRTALRRLDAGGAVVWTYPLPAGALAVGQPALNPNGLVLLLTNDGRLTAVDPELGTSAWNVKNGVSSQGALAIGATGIAYFGVESTLWAVTINGGAFGSAALDGQTSRGVAVFNTAYQCCVPSDLVYSTTAGSSGLWRLVAALNSTNWKKSPASNLPPVFDYDGDTWVVSAAGALVAKNVDGNDKWTFTPPGGATVTTPPAVGAGVVVVGDSLGRVFALGSP
jgi:hypothetical protein